MELEISNHKKADLSTLRKTTKKIIIPLLGITLSLSLFTGCGLNKNIDTNYENNVVVEHNDGVLSKYAHGSKLLVVEGDRVNAGDEIMLVGQTGMATGPHLHFEMQNADGEYIDVNQMFEQ